MLKTTLALLTSGGIDLHDEKLLKCASEKQVVNQRKLTPKEMERRLKRAELDRFYFENRRPTVIEVLAQQVPFHFCMEWNITRCTCASCRSASDPFVRARTKALLHGRPITFELMESEDSHARYRQWQFNCKRLDMLNEASAPQEWQQFLPEPREEQLVMTVYDLAHQDRMIRRDTCEQLVPLVHSNKYPMLDLAVAAILAKQVLPR